MLSYSTCSRRIPPPYIDSHKSSLQKPPGGWLFLLATFLREKTPPVFTTKINGIMYQKEDPLQFDSIFFVRRESKSCFWGKVCWLMKNPWWFTCDKYIYIYIHTSLKLTESPLKMMIFPNPESPFPVGYFPWFHGLLFTLADGDCNLVSWPSYCWWFRNPKANLRLDVLNTL